MVKGITVGSGVGILVGILLVWWIRPDNDGGTAMVIVGSVVFFTVTSTIFSVLRNWISVKTGERARRQPSNAFLLFSLFLAVGHRPLARVAGSTFPATWG